MTSTILDFAECRYSRITDPPFPLSTPPSTHSLLLSEARMAPKIQACNGGRRRSTAYPDLLHGKKNQTNPQESVQTRSRLVWGYRLRHLPRGVWVCLGCGVSVRWHDLCINTPFPRALLSRLSNTYMSAGDHSILERPLVNWAIP